MTCSEFISDSMELSCFLVSSSCKCTTFIKALYHSKLATAPGDRMPLFLQAFILSMIHFQGEQETNWWLQLCDVTGLPYFDAGIVPPLVSSKHKLCSSVCFTDWPESVRYACQHTSISLTFSSLTLCVIGNAYIFTWGNSALAKVLC